MRHLCWIVQTAYHYHVARARAFARDGNARITLLQLSTSDPFAQLVWKDTPPPGVTLATVEGALAHIHTSLDKIQPEVVCVNGWGMPGSSTTLLWCLRNRRPAIMMSESTQWDFERSFWREHIKRSLIRLCAAVLCGGTPHRTYVEELGAPRDSIFTGYNAVDNDYFTEAASVALDDAVTRREKYRLPKHYFLASCRFEEKKNLLRLIQAYAKYRQQTSQSEPWHLIVLGDGKLRPQIEAELRRLQLEGVVLLPGFTAYETLPTYYAHADGFIHASTTEQWGLVVNEAMACGLPVLASERCGCVPDLVQPGGNGSVFDPYSVDSIADRMTTFAQLSNEKREAMGTASRHIIQNWGPARFAEGLRSAATKALAVGSRRGTLHDRLLLHLLTLVRP